MFLRQEGHLSADDLVDLIQREDHRISRATVYRTLQWMVDAGIARKVDFGEGRFRFEHSYRHPRHFHLICKTCNRSFEFLSSDIEALVEEVAAARAFTARQSVVQIYGTCEECQHRPRAQPTSGQHRAAVRARRAAHRDCHRAQRPRVLHARGAQAGEGRARPRGLPASWRPRRSDHLEHARGALPASCSSAIRSSSRGRRSCSSRARPTACSPRAPSSCAATASTISEALRIGIRCERGSHRFFKRYGERFEDSEGKQIFLEFADEEREHLELLIREYRALVKRRHAGPAAARGRPRRVRRAARKPRPST